MRSVADRSRGDSAAPRLDPQRERRRCSPSTSDRSYGRRSANRPSRSGIRSPSPATRMHRATEASSDSPPQPLTVPRAPPKATVESVDANPAVPCYLSARHRIIGAPLCEELSADTAAPDLTLLTLRWKELSAVVPRVRVPLPARPRALARAASAASSRVCVRVVVGIVGVVWSCCCCCCGVRVLCRRCPPRGSHRTVPALVPRSPCSQGPPPHALGRLGSGRGSLTPAHTSAPEGSAGTCTTRTRD